MEKNKFVNLFNNYINKGNNEGSFSISNKMMSGEEEELAHAVSARVGVSYLDNSGDVENKDIIIRRVIHKNNDLIIEAFDESAKEARIFFASIIQKIIELSTQEEFDNPKDFLSLYMGIRDVNNLTDKASDFDTVISTVRSEVTALVFLASVDGHYMEAQKKMILQYIQERSKNIPINLDEVLMYLNRLHPDMDSFFSAIDDLSSQSSAVIQLFLECFVKLIYADNIVDSKEKIALSELLDTFKEDGLDIKIAV